MANNKTTDNEKKNDEPILVTVQAGGRIALPAAAKKILGLIPGTTWELIPSKKNGVGLLKFKAMK